MEINTEENTNFSKRNIFTVEDRYFDQLENRIHQRTKEKESLLPYAFQSNGLRIAIATACLMLVFFLWPSSEISSPEKLLADVSDEQLVRYLEENSIHEIDDFLSYEEFNLEELHEIDLNTNNDSIL